MRYLEQFKPDYFLCISKYVCCRFHQVFGMRTYFREMLCVSRVFNYSRDGRARACGIRTRAMADRRATEEVLVAGQGGEAARDHAGYE